MVPLEIHLDDCCPTFCNNNNIEKKLTPNNHVQLNKIEKTKKKIQTYKVFRLEAMEANASLSMLEIWFSANDLVINKKHTQL